MLKPSHDPGGVPYSRRDVDKTAHSEAVNKFLAARKNLSGSHPCICGVSVEPKSEYEHYGHHGYQWSTGRCERCRRDLAAFGEAARHESPKSKRRELEDFYTADRYTRIEWRYCIGLIGSAFTLEQKGRRKHP
jgi:hypothetical protein